MTYAILDSTANLVDAFDDPEEARHALEVIVHQDPESADDYALFTYDDEGQPVGEALLASQLGIHA